MSKPSSRTIKGRYNDFCIAIFVAAFGNLAANDWCLQDWTYVKGSCYKGFGVNMNYWESRDNCQSYGGNLASSKYPEVQSFLGDYYLNNGKGK